MAPTASRRGVQLTIVIDGRERVNVALTRFLSSLSDLRRFWREYVAPKLWRDWEDNFEMEGGRVEGWAPLSPKYAEWKAKHYPGKPLLVRTGRMKRSLTSANDGGFLDAGLQSMVIGTRVKYARYHQHGTPRMPQRRIVYMSRGASETFGRMLHAYAVAEAKTAGLRTRAAIRAAS